MIETWSKVVIHATTGQLTEDGFGSQGLLMRIEDAHAGVRIADLLLSPDNVRRLREMLARSPDEHDVFSGTMRNTHDERIGQLRSGPNSWETRTPSMEPKRWRVTLK